MKLNDFKNCKKQIKEDMAIGQPADNSFGVKDLVQYTGGGRHNGRKGTIIKMLSDDLATVKFAGAKTAVSVKLTSLALVNDKAPQAPQAAEKDNDNSISSRVKHTFWDLIGQSKLAKSRNQSLEYGRLQRQVAKVRKVAADRNIELTRP